MNPNAFTILLVTELTITAFMVYYFWKVVTTPPKAEPDSYAGNDDIPR